MSSSDPSVARWLIRVRTRGEVLTAGARERGLELHFLDLSTGFTPREIEGWLRDLMGVALQTSSDEDESKPIPALLHHALTGLLFSHAELWHGPGLGPCTAAFVDAETGPGFGWVGDAAVEVWQGGQLCDVPWIRVRDEEGREARAFQFNPERDVQIQIIWPIAAPGASPRGAEVDAEWISPASRPASQTIVPTRPAAAAPVEEPVAAYEAALPEGQPGLAPPATGAPSVASEPEVVEVAEADAPAPTSERERRKRWAGFRGLLRGLMPWTKPEPEEAEVAAGPAAEPEVSNAAEEPPPDEAQAAPSEVTVTPDAPHAHPRAPALTSEADLAELVAAVTAASAQERAAHSSATAPATGADASTATPEPATAHSAPPPIGAAAAPIEGLSLAPPSSSGPATADPIAPPLPHSAGPPRMPSRPPTPRKEPIAPTPDHARAQAAMSFELESVTTLASKLQRRAATGGPGPPQLRGASPEAPAASTQTPESVAATGASAPPIGASAPPSPPEAPAQTPIPPHAPRSRASAPPGAPTKPETPPGRTRFPRPTDRPPVPGPIHSDPEPPGLLSPPEHAAAAPAEIASGAAPGEAVVSAVSASAATGAEAAAAGVLPTARGPKVRRPEWPTLEERPRFRGPWKQRAIIGGALAVLFIVGWMVGSSHHGPQTGPNQGAIGKVLTGLGVRAMHADLAVTSRPPGAWIAVDGKDAARRTPATVELVRGKHQITLSLPGLGSADFPVDADRGQHLTMDVPLWGSLAVYPANPAYPLSVSLDGAPRGFAPIEVDSLDPGLHELAFSGPRMAAWAQTVEIRIGEKTEFVARASTSPATGMVVVRGTFTDETGDHSASGAQVWVDGQFRGLVPLSLELSRGPHSVRVAYRGQQAPIQVIDLPGGNQRFVDFAFGGDLDEPRLTLVSSPGRVTLERPGVVSAALSGVAPGDLREMWLHARSPDGLWRRYEMTLMKSQGTLVGTTVFPATLLDAQGTSRFYVSALTQQGDEYFTEILSVPPAGGGSAPAPTPPPGDAPETPSQP